MRLQSSAKRNTTCLFVLGRSPRKSYTNASRLATVYQSSSRRIGLPAHSNRNHGRQQKTCRRLAGKYQSPHHPEASPAAPDERRTTKPLRADGPGRAGDPELGKPEANAAGGSSACAGGYGPAGGNVSGSDSASGGVWTRVGKGWQERIRVAQEQNERIPLIGEPRMPSSRRRSPR